MTDEKKQSATQNRKARRRALQGEEAPQVAPDIITAVRDAVGNGYISIPIREGLRALVWRPTLEDVEKN